MDILGGLAAAGQAIEIAKAMRNVERAYEAVELKGQIVELMDKLLDVKSALQDARLAAEADAQEITRLRDAARFRGETVEVGGLRFHPSVAAPGKAQGTPFCLRCEQVEGVMITTVQPSRGMGTACPECKTAYSHAHIFSWDTE